MKIILSRKGFDSGYGGCPSPIFPDGRFFSFPIPVREAPSRFSDLFYDEYSVGDLVESLSQNRIHSQSPTHLDPDLHRSLMAREANWLPAFGQTGAAQSHLASRAIGPGDLFLFFGWFRRVLPSSVGWRYEPGAPNQHIIFGWLQVDEVFNVGQHTASYAERYPWLARHPHLHGERSANNTIYIARKTLQLPGLKEEIAGGGTFRRIRPDLVLTAPNQDKRSLWCLPRFFSPGMRTPLSYHKAPSRWQDIGAGNVHLQSVAKGQEFILDTEEYPEVMDWTKNLIQGE